MFSLTRRIGFVPTIRRFEDHPSLTDRGWPQQKFYRTLKQEEVYCASDYLSIDSAREAIGRHIDHHNVVGSRQALL